MSRRASLIGLILFVAVWSGVLLYPPTRLMLQAQIAPQGIDLYNGFDRDRNWFTPVLQKYPNDPRVLAVDAGIMRAVENSNEDFRKPQLRRYDELIQKFPEELWLIQNRLRLTTSGGFVIDVGKLARKEQQSVKSWLSDEEVIQSIKIAELGARRDPNNSFYDWMRAIFFFHMKRPEGALRAMSEGASKSDFDDGTYKDVQIRIEVREMQRPLLWEERISIFASMLLPHFASMRQANNAALWQGAIAEGKNHHARALEIYADQMQLAAVMRRKSTSYISMVMAEQFQRNTWGSVARREAGKTAVRQNQLDRFRQLQIQTTDLARAFANYAQRHDREDLGRMAQLEAAEIYDRLGQPHTWSDFYGTAEANARRIFQLHWVNHVSVRIVFLSACSWLIFYVVLRLIQRILRSENSVTRVLSPLDITASSLFVLVACGVLFSLALSRGTSAEGYYWLAAMMGAEESTSYPDNLASARAIAQWLIWLPLLLTIAYCYIATSWRDRKVSSVSAQGVSDDIGTARLVTATSLGVTVVAVALFSVWWWNWLLWQGLNDILTFAGLALPLLIAVLLFRRRERFLTMRPTFFVFAWAWMQSTLGCLAVIFSLTYLAIALAAMPLRREADRKFDVFVERGEGAAIRAFAAEQQLR